jgi:hypothetical protein
MDTELIDRLVKERFPKLKTEWSCITEKRFRDAARAAYRLKLIDEFSRAQEILASSGEADAQAGAQLRGEDSTPVERTG